MEMKMTRCGLHCRRFPHLVLPVTHKINLSVAIPPTSQNGFYRLLNQGE
jgi:hypothetical protein